MYSSAAACKGTTTMQMTAPKMVNLLMPSAPASGIPKAMATAAAPNTTTARTRDLTYAAQFQPPRDDEYDEKGRPRTMRSASARAGSMPATPPTATRRPGPE